MPIAIQAKTLPSKVAARSAKARDVAQKNDAATARGSFAGKTFAELLPPDKEAALKALLLQAGMIEPDAT